MNKKKNMSIDIYRILFTTFILLHHFHMYSDELPYGGGYMATDFFFILSGYLMYRRYAKEKMEPESLIKYLRRRYWRLFMPLVVCNILLLIISKVIINYSLSGKMWLFLKENFMLEIYISDAVDRFNAPTWYLGVLLIASAVIYSVLLVTRNAKAKMLIRAIVFGVLFLAYMVIIFVNGHGNVYPQHKAVIDIYTIIRGLSGVAIGAVIGGLNIEINDSMRRIVMYVILPVFWIYMLLWKNGYTRFDVLVYILIVIGVFLCSTTVSDPKESNMPNLVYSCIIRCLSILAASSYIAYLMHYPLIRIMANLSIFNGFDWKVYSLIYLCIVWLLAVVVDKGIKIVKKVGKRYNEFEL